MEKFPKLKEKLRIVIFCGGFGTRMWPMSRRECPKQFQPLLGEKSFFQATYERLRLVFKSEEIFASTSQDQVGFIKKQIPGFSDRNIIAEPERRDTFGAIGYSTVYLDKLFPNSLMAVTWCDGYIRDDQRYAKLFFHGARVAQNLPVICMMQVRPVYPTTQLGWVKIGKLVGKVGNYKVCVFERHLEKPDLATAKKLFSQKNWLVNPGFYVWRTSTMMGFYQNIAPDDYRHLLAIKKALGTKDEKKIASQEYSRLQKTSVDFGIYEKLPSKSQLVIVSDLWWHDVGTWDLLYEAMISGQRQNIIKGDAEVIDSQGNLVYLPKNKIAAIIGAENLVVVDTADGLLVCQRGRAGEVKKFVESLEDKGKEEYL
jgi:mannose-1-phosphate guanylyltransferase